MWVCSRVLNRLGYDRHTPDPPGGRIERDADGEPTGILRENALGPVYELMPEPDETQMRARTLPVTSTGRDKTGVEKTRTSGREAAKRWSSTK